MKSKYPYSKELKRAISFSNIDLEEKIRDGSLAKVAGFLSKQVSSYKSKIAKVRKDTYHSFDQKSITFYEFTPKKEEPLYPAMIYCHGGGFMFPIQRSMMNNSALYAENTGVKVFLPEYRLSLDSPCDTTLEDCYAMLKFVFENAEKFKVDKNRVFLYGDSAGGCLAAGIALLNRDRNHYPLCGQMLIYPVCDNERGKYESMEKYKDAAWSKNSNEQMWRIYLSRGVEKETYTIPMKNELHDLPPAYIEPQQFDTLRDEAIAYANKLKNAEVDVDLNVISGSYHGFDADLKSPLVKRVFEKRYEVIRKFIQ